MADRLLWFSLVTEVASTRRVPDRAMIDFVQAFLKENASSEGWVGMFRADSFRLFLLCVEIMPEAWSTVGTRAQQSTAVRRRDGKGSAASKSKEPEPRRKRARPTELSAESQKHKSSKNTCFSRTRVDAVCRAVGKCAFSHACSVCGEDHALKNCPE
jgi:hypothetical protein